MWSSYLCEVLVATLNSWQSRESLPHVEANDEGEDHRPSDEEEARLLTQALLDRRLLIERWLPGDDRPEILADRITWTPVAGGEAFELALEPFFAEVNGDNL